MSTTTMQTPTATFRRVFIDLFVKRERTKMNAYHLHDSSWAVAKIDNAVNRREMWAVFHVPTGLLVRQGITSFAEAKKLATRIRNENPETPALGALAFGTAPSPVGDVEAYGEALDIHKTITAWSRHLAVGD